MLSPPSSTLELEKSLQQLGASKKQINAWQHNLNARTNTKPMPVAKHNWQALNLFLLLATQWRIHGNTPTGIDYSAIAPTAQLAGITLSTNLFAQIRRMEQIALDIFAQKHAQQKNLAG